MKVKENVTPHLKILCIYCRYSHIHNITLFLMSSCLVLSPVGLMRIMAIFSPLNCRFSTFYFLLIKKWLTVWKWTYKALPNHKTVNMVTIRTQQHYFKGATFNNFSYFPNFSSCLNWQTQCEGSRGNLLTLRPIQSFSFFLLVFSLVASFKSVHWRLMNNNKPTQIWMRQFIEAVCSFSASPGGVCWQQLPVKSGATETHH